MGYLKFCEKMGKKLMDVPLVACDDIFVDLLRDHSNSAHTT